MIMPKPGTPSREEFARRAAKDPNSVEAKVMRKVVEDSTAQAQQQVREMLHLMIEVVPGQLFRDIGRFHEKFGLAPTTDPGHRLPEDLLKFRIKFMFEELGEYVEAVGGSYYCPDIDVDGSKFNAEEAFDGLIDLVVVALGTAYLHGFNFNAGWDKVQAANMAKERATGPDDPRSKRGHAADVVKPVGWQKPALKDLL